MPSEPVHAEFEPRKRLHPLSWIFVSIEYVKQFIFPVLAAIFLGARQDSGAWTALLVIPLIGGALWQQWIYRYDFGPRSLVIREGLLFRNVRNIDYQRIENVDTERNLLHRLFNVAQVRIETSSGGGSEAVVRVLDMAAVQEMRERIFHARETSAAAEPAAVASEKTLLHLPPAELLRFGLIDNRGLIVVAAAFGLVSQVGSEQLVKRWMAPFIEGMPVDSFAGLAPILQAFFVFSTIIGLIVGTRILSVLFAFVTLHDFRLTQSQDDLRVQHGLLTRISLTLRRPRIQAVHQRTSVLHRWFKRTSLTVDLAGGIGSQGTAQEGNAAQAREPWLAPVCEHERADELIRIALPSVALEQANWQGLAAGARGRLFRLTTMLWLLVSVPGSIALFGWRIAPWVVLPVIPLLWLHAHLYVKYTGWALHENFFAVKRGWLTRRVSVTPRNRVQAVRLSESPFDRRYGMASLLVDTAGARSRQLRIPYLDARDARELLRALRRQ